ncbi:MAG: hypothetical protein ACRCZP_19995 [Phycicoccus sp.]
MPSAAQIRYLTNLASALDPYITGGGGGGGAATQLDANGTILDVNVISDGNLLRRTGTTVVGATCTAAGYALLDDADASAQRTTLGLGTAATQSASAFEAAGGIATHAALASGVHGISTFGATLVDDANAAAARATLGLATIAESGSASDLGAGTVPVARLPAATTTAIGAVELATDGEVAPGVVVQGNDSRLATFGSASAGLVPASGGGTTNFLRADGTFADPGSGGGGGITHPQVLARGLGA